MQQPDKMLLEMSANCSSQQICIISATMAAAYQSDDITHFFALQLSDLMHSLFLIGHDICFDPCQTVQLSLVPYHPALNMAIKSNIVIPGRGV
jgi:hypothetical protein